MKNIAMLDISNFVQSYLLSILLYLGFFIVVFLICIYVIRYIFRIPEMLDLLKAQTQLLKLIAGKQGVEQSEITKAITGTEPTGSVSVPVEKVFDNYSRK